MLRRLCFRIQCMALASLATASVLTQVACGSLLGIDDGIPRDDRADGSDVSDVSMSSDAFDATMGSDSPDDVTTGADSSDRGSDGADRMDARDAGQSRDVEQTAESGAAADAAHAGDAANVGDSETARDAGAYDAPGDGCVDPGWCTAHCGPGPDNCGVSRQCVDYCSGNSICDVVTNSCTCQRDPRWCSGRCGMMRDNCGDMIDCGTCGSGAVCSGNTCGCVSMPNPCGKMQCGQTLDSCGHPIVCGVNGMCPSGGVCNIDAGTCCTPIGDPCRGRCQTSIDDGCGQLIVCPPGCPAGDACDQSRCCTAPQCGNSCNVTVLNGCGTSSVTCACSGVDVCYQGQCCTPNPNQGCSPTCFDNCGQPAPCCPPMDAGSQCTAPGGTCPGGQGCCPGESCNAEKNCVPMCSTTSCLTLADCCYGFSTCFQFLGPPDGGPVITQSGPGMCR